MNKLTPLLGSLLVISIAVNVIAVVRLTKKRSVGEKQSDSSPSSPATIYRKERGSVGGNADTALILAEIRRLAKKVGSARRPVATPELFSDGGSSSGGGGGGEESSSNPFEISPVLAADPNVQTLLVEREKRDRYWEDLRILSDLREGLGNEKHRELAIAATADFLGLDASTASSFSGIADSVLTDIAYARRNRITTNESVNASNTLSDKEKEAERRKNWGDFEAYKKQRKDQLTGLLSGDPRQERFARALEYWIYRVAPEASDRRRRR